MNEFKCFKECTMCGRIWESRENFLSDPQIIGIGYMVNFRELELGLFLFNHELCGTTLAIEAAEFIDLYDGPVFVDRLMDTEECPEYCMHNSELRPCPAQCECTHVRQVLDIVVNWSKS